MKTEEDRKKDETYIKLAELRLTPPEPRKDRLNLVRSVAKILKARTILHDGDRVGYRRKAMLECIKMLDTFIGNNP